MCELLLPPTIPETLQCWNASPGLSWRRWRRSHGDAVGAGDFANSITADAQTVELYGKIGIRPTFIMPAAPVHVLVSSSKLTGLTTRTTGIQRGINGNNGNSLNSKDRSLRVALMAKDAKAKAREKARPKRLPCPQSRNSAQLLWGLRHQLRPGSRVCRVRQLLQQLLRVVLHPAIPSFEGF